MGDGTLSLGNDDFSVHTLLDTYVFSSKYGGSSHMQLIRLCLERDGVIIADLSLRMDRKDGVEFCLFVLAKGSVHIRVALRND